MFPYGSPDSKLDLDGTFQLLAPAQDRSISSRVPDDQCLEFLEIGKQLSLKL